MYGLFLLTLIFTIIYICLFYYSPRNEKNQNKLKIFGIVFFCLSNIILFFIETIIFRSPINGDKSFFEFYKYEMLDNVNNLNKYWKNKMIFNLDKNTKDIICNVKLMKIIGKILKIIQILKMKKILILLQYNQKKVVKIVI